MLTALRVENYRSFKNRTDIELRPLTLFLGKNSSGKSSLTRLFPLLQQSVDRQSASPILWTAVHVDFGGIDEVITHGSEGELKIGLAVETNRLRSFIHRGIVSRRQQTNEPTSTLCYSVRLAGRDGRTISNGIHLSVDTHNIEIDWDESGIIAAIRVDGVRYPLDGNEYQAITKDLFPDIENQSADNYPSYRRNANFYPRLEVLMTNVMHGKTSKAKIQSVINNFGYIPKANSVEVIRSLPHIVKNRVTQQVADQIADASLINSLPEILSFLEFSLIRTLRGTAYIGPIRASGQRFARIQELAVDRLDASGENTAMYLRSLGKEQLASFNSLLLETTGHELKVESSGPGHVSLMIGQPEGTHFENISDVGFGFSQLVPVLAQLHALTSSPSESRGIFNRQQIFAVEQPELHLHPALQGNIADLLSRTFCSEASVGAGALCIVETHSESIVARLSQLVAEQIIKPEHVAIYFVEKDADDSASSIRLAEFSSDGIIDSWPIGFFAA